MCDTALVPHPTTDAPCHASPFAPEVTHCVEELCRTVAYINLLGWWQTIMTRTTPSVFQGPDARLQLEWLIAGATESRKKARLHDGRTIRAPSGRGRSTGGGGGTITIPPLCNMWA